MNTKKLKNNLKIRIHQQIIQSEKMSLYWFRSITSRFGEARISLPGGCHWTRPIDIHLAGLSKLVNFEIQNVLLLVVLNHNWLVIKLNYLSKCRSYWKYINGLCIGKGETKISNAAREPEIEDLSNCLIKMGAVIARSWTKTILVQGVAKLKKAEHDTMLIKL